MIDSRKKFVVVFKADIFYVSDKLVIARLSRTIWPIFSRFSYFVIANAHSHRNCIHHKTKIKIDH